MSVAVTDEISPGVVADYDEFGNVIGLEIIAASKRVTLPQRVEHEVVLSSSFDIGQVSAA